MLIVQFCCCLLLIYYCEHWDDLFQTYFYLQLTTIVLLFGLFSLYVVFELDWSFI